MKTLKKLNAIKTYSGYKENEGPLEFVFDNKIVIVESIIERKTIEDSETRMRKDYFKIKSKDKHTYTLFYDQNSKEWFLEE